MSQATLRCTIEFHSIPRIRPESANDERISSAVIEPGRVPRVARLMALAIRLDALIAKAEIRNYAELARLGHVTRARMTQIMNLVNLAADIQEQILFLPRVKSGRDPILLAHLQTIASRPDWPGQRRSWRRLVRQSPSHGGFEKRV